MHFYLHVQLDTAIIFWGYKEGDEDRWPGRLDNVSHYEDSLSLSAFAG